MNNLNLKVKRLQITVIILIGLNVFVMITAFRSNRASQHEKFDQISVDRINIVDKKGTIKMVIASQDMLRMDSRDANVDGFTYSGLLFRNEEGEECGGLIYNGKKTKNGQEADAGLTFDQYNQDQNVVLSHKELIDSNESSINDGLAIIQRPNYTKVKEEYQKYAQIENMNLTKDQKDSVRSYYASQDIVSRRRLFIGTDRGTKNNKPYNETGLFIKNKAGNAAIKLYVDNDNIPHFEIYEPGGKKKVYELNVKGKK
jgi:hypothetical protein